MGGKEFIITNQGHFIYIITGKIWYFLLSLYALLNLNNSRNKWLPVLIILLTISNMTFAFPYVFNRFGYIVLIVFVFVLINDYKVYKFNYFFAISYSLLSLMTTSLDIIITRDNFEISYKRYALLSLPTMLLIDPTDGRKFDKGYL